MTLVACGEYLICGESNVPPACAMLPKALYRPFAVGSVLSVGGNQVRNRLTVPRYGNGLPMLDRPKEFGQARLGFGSLYLSHVKSNLLF